MNNSEPNFRLSCKTKSKLNQTFEIQNVSKKQLIFQVAHMNSSMIGQHFKIGDMTVENHGSVWQFDHKFSFSNFNLSDGKQVRKCFGWTNLRPCNRKKNASKMKKVDLRLYLLQKTEVHHLFETGYEKSIP